MQQIVDGLQYLHSNNILHRDMKLPNLLVTSEMRVKIADFGLATQLKWADEKHMTMCGTPNYISPEVALRTSHGLPADVWGLGIMMYTLLVGRPPFDTDGVASTLKKVCTSELMIPIHMSTEAKDLLGRLLQKDPMQRIRLDEVLRHPFMRMHHVGAASADSGVMTMSSTPSLLTTTPRNERSVGTLPRTRSAAEPYRYQLQTEVIRESSSELFGSNYESGYAGGGGGGGEGVGQQYGRNVGLKRFGSLDLDMAGDVGIANGASRSFCRSTGMQRTHFSDNVLDNRQNRPNDPGGGCGEYFTSHPTAARFTKENVMVSVN